MEHHSGHQPDLHVGVVAYELEGRRSGVGRYLEGLLTGLQTESPTNWTWTLFFKGEPFESERFETEPCDSRRFRAVFDHRPEARPILWEQTRLPFLLRDHDLGFLFSPAYSLPPFSGVPRMLTLHDLSFEHLPEEFTWRERWRRRHLARLAARRADRILTDTSRVARDIETTYGVEPERIGIVPLAVDAEFFAGYAMSARPLPEELHELGIRPPYLLHLGTLLPRRRIDLTLSAFAALAEDKPELQPVIAGADRLPNPRELERRVEASGRNASVLRLQWVPEALLVPLYSHAAASIYISSYEGYGLPPLESLATGTPAVVSEGLALDDLWPDYPYRVRLDGTSLLEGIRRVLGESHPAAFSARARSLVGRLDWQAGARALVQEIRIARNAGRSRT